MTGSVVLSKSQMTAWLLEVFLVNSAFATSDVPNGLCLSDCPNLVSGQAPSQECQNGSTQQDGDADKEERKRYIQGVLSKSNVQEKRLVLRGSGFFVAEDGSLITNHRLVSDCTLISISPIIGDMVMAETIAQDATTDLALLRAPLDPPAIASLIESEGTLKREPIYVVGYPDLGPITSTPGLTPVEVLGSQRTVFNVSTIIFKGDVTSGNNGGPLLDSGGGVVGAVLSSKSQAYIATDAAPSSVGLALPSEALRKFLDSHQIDYRIGLELPPKPADRLLIDARRFMAQIGCWQ